METTLYVNDVQFIIFHNKICNNSPTLLFIHGLGENSQCFYNIFDYQWTSNYNIIIPDLPGFGKSSLAIDYSFEKQIERLNKLLDVFDIKECIVIGHSMGADLATIMCFQDQQKRIKKLVNIEGTLTQQDLFISKKIVEAAKLCKFDSWFDEFKEKTVLNKWGKMYMSCKRYFDALKLAQKDALIESAEEIIKNSKQMGEIYKHIKVPKIFCYGTESLCSETFDFLQTNHLKSIAFKNAFHWPMIDNKEEFYEFLNVWLKQKD